MKLTESIENKLATVYHSSGDVHCFEYILNHDWRDGDEGQAYGSGLYTCWSIASAFEAKDSLGNSIMPKEHYLRKDIEAGRACMNEFGEYICFRFEFLVDLTNYFFFPEPNNKEKSQIIFEKYKLVHPESTATVDNFVAEQNRYFELNYHNIGDAINDRRRHTNTIDGIVFMGSHDGDVVVAYNTDMAIPTRFSKGDKDVWFPINDDKDYAEKAKLAALGITSPESFWNAFAFSDEAKSFMNNLGDANQLDYLVSNGTEFNLEDSTEEYIETIDNFIDKTKKKIELKNCLEAKQLNLKKSTNDPISGLSLIIENEADSDLEEILENGQKINNFYIEDSFKFIINRSPNLDIEVINVSCNKVEPNSVFKLRLVKTDVVKATSFEDVKLINIKTEEIIIDNCKNILLKNLNLPSVPVIIKGDVNKVVIKGSTLGNLKFEDGASKDCLEIDELSEINVN